MATLPLTRGRVTLVDEDVLREQGHFRWHCTANGYAARRVGKSILLLHREVAGATDHQVVHHRNGNTLDNRRENLELIDTQATHCAEHNLSRRYRDGPRGVYPVAGSSTWRVQFRIGGTAYSFGCYPTREEAERVAKDVQRKRNEARPP